MADKKPTVTITKLTDWISVKEFEGDKGNLVRYFAQPNNRAASTSSVLRYAAENKVTVTGLLDMLRVPKATKKVSSGKPVAQAFNHQKFIEKLEEYDQDKQVVILSRLGDQEVRAVDLALRGKQVTNRGPKTSVEKSMTNIFATLGLPYFINEDGDIEEISKPAGFQENFDAYFDGV